MWRECPGPDGALLLWQMWVPPHPALCSGDSHIQVISSALWTFRLTVCYTSSFNILKRQTHWEGWFSKTIWAKSLIELDTKTRQTSRHQVTSQLPNLTAITCVTSENLGDRDMELSRAQASGSDDPGLITDHIIYSVAGHTLCEEALVSYSVKYDVLQHLIGIKWDSIKEWMLHVSVHHWVVRDWMHKWAVAALHIPIELWATVCHSWLRELTLLYVTSPGSQPAFSKSDLAEVRLLCLVNNLGSQAISPVTIGSKWAASPVFALFQFRTSQGKPNMYSSQSHRMPASR